MIPHKLELKNFLSYGSDAGPIDFGNYQLICLSGKNGNGKSALLDAMTWALWGQARKIVGATKADEGLLRLGQTDMMVIFEFECNQQRYRIRREFTKSYGRNQVTLDFELFNKTSGLYVSLTDTTVRNTQMKIISLLGLDFETFVNTAFLRQGQSNEFSCKNPKERKQILSSILGLSRYDDLRGSALERARKCSNEKNVLVAVDEQALKELLREKELLEKECEYKKDIAEHEEKIIACSLSLEQAEKQRFDLLGIKQKRMFFAEEIENKKNEKAGLEKEFLKAVDEWKRVHAKSLKWSDIATLEEEKKRLIKQERVFRHSQQKMLELQERFLKYQELLRSALEKCRREHEKKSLSIKEELDISNADYKQHVFIAQQNTNHLFELEKELKIINEELISNDKKIKDHITLEEIIKTHGKQFEKRRSFYQVLVSNGNWIASQLRECEGKKVLLNNKDNPACPTCDQILTARRKLFLANKFDKNESLFLHQLDRVRRVLSKLKDILKRQHEQSSVYTKQHDELKKCVVIGQSHIKRRDELERECEGRGKQKILFLQQAVVIEKNIQGLQKRHDEHIKTLEDFLGKDSVVAQQHLEIEKIDKEKKDNFYDKSKHQEVLKNLEKCEERIQDLSSIKKEISGQDGRRSRIDDYINLLRKLKYTLKGLCEKSKKFNVTEQRQKNSDKKVCDVKKELALLLKGKEERVQSLGSVTSDLKRLEQYKAESKKRKKFLAALTTEMDEYQTLATIFGKDGIQALLIEEAIPEIEDEANRLLAQLTDNNAQVMIESLRDLKKGGAKETLEIKISDSFGIRPYEMFSGGEAFRIDFALRIAISRLLARRAGTALQTLIIDEGFGSQDEDGLARLMDALHMLRNDFARVIVVSHLSAFKDNFPVHFVVEKNATGSYVTTVERG